MHILVTGGTGFFGKALLRYWAARMPVELENFRITLISRSPREFSRNNSEFLEKLNVQIIFGDIQKPNSLRLDDYTHILHAAADSTRGLSLSPMQRYMQIAEGTRNVLDLAVKCRSSRFLMISSGGVYGPSDQYTDGIPEDYNGIPDPLEPENAYSLAKRQAEHLCALYKKEYNRDFVVARCFSFIGEDLPLNAHFAIGNFINDLIECKNITIKGDGSQVRSYMDQRDLARWLTVLMFKGETGCAYNVGSPDAITLKELAEKIANIDECIKSKVVILNSRTHGQSANRDYYVPNVTRAKRELGLECEVELTDSIRYTLTRKKLIAPTHDKILK